MLRWFNGLDRILRGEATRLSALREEGIDIPLGGLVLIIVLLAALYGVCMGFFNGFGEGGPFLSQWFAGVVKVPSLFFLTLAVTFPSLYVFNALVGSRLNFMAVLQLLVVSLAVNLAVLASLGPIVAFFSVSTTSYPFILLLNVLVFAVSGVLGFAFMLQTLYRLSSVRHSISAPPPRLNNPEGEDVPETGQAEKRSEEQATPVEAQLIEIAGVPRTAEGRVLDRQVKTIFLCWMVAFGLVGTQMAWVLRPFLGKPSEPFRWFCPRESNFFQAVWNAFHALIS